MSEIKIWSACDIKKLVILQRWWRKLKAKSQNALKRKYSELFESESESESRKIQRIYNNVWFEYFFEFVGSVYRNTFNFLAKFLGL